MGLIKQTVKKPEESGEFTKEEVQFILTKLRSANYKGDEFEQFFTVMKKLTDYLKTL